MQKNYSIEEILNAVNDLQNTKEKKFPALSKRETINKDNSNIPKDTLKLIEQAENAK